MSLQSSDLRRSWLEGDFFARATFFRADAILEVDTSVKVF